MKLISGREDINANPDSSSEPGLTPLLWTARNDHEGIVKLLLQREDVNPDTPDAVYDQTPLSWAARKGHEGMVKQLLEREGVNPDIPDTEDGGTPLM